MAAQTYTFATRPNGPRHIGSILYIPGAPTINAPSNRQQETVDQFLVRYNRSKIDWDSKASRGKFAGLGVPVFADGMQRSPKMVLTGVRGGDWVLPTPEWVAASAGRGQMGRISPGRTYITSATLGQALIAAIAGAPDGAALPLAPPAPILLPLAAPPASLPTAAVAIDGFPSAPLRAPTPAGPLHDPPNFSTPLSGLLFFMATLDSPFLAVLDPTLREDYEDDDDE